MEDDKRGDRNPAKAEAARRLTRLLQGTFWIGTERTLTRRRHYNLVYLHARRKIFPAFADIASAVQELWPWGEVAPVEEIARRLSQQWPPDLVEATCTGYVRRVTHDEIADAVCTVFRHHHLQFPSHHDPFSATLEVEASCFE